MKRAEAESCDHRREVLDRAVEESEQEHECQEHEEAAPQHVGDVDPVGPDPRVARESEEPADPQKRSDGRDEEALEEQRRLGIACQPAQ